ncbi:hypothetical protein [Streptomyces brasiliensis]|uniref:Secreted protein n=1 Tax=Streptomyces brasiliensis TaxID=1954 RepID=A0A917PDA4_9ACTN|nr:hypothetical protein [Streptomyces brasiliensis]GGJ71535.1 hypothetical protein GCM10010121_097710 [Streptomyces brasiliensis]
MHESRWIRRLPLAAAAAAVLAGGLALPAQTAFAAPQTGATASHPKPHPKPHANASRVNKCNFIHYGDYATFGKPGGVDPKDYYDCYPPH